MSLIVFALCLLIGGFGADNGFGATVTRALIAMAGTFVIALVIGHMAKRMIAENVAATVNQRAERAAVALTKSPEKSAAK